MAALPAEARKLLDYIARPESGGRYNVVYGGGTFDDYSAHPGIYNTIGSGPNAGKKSSAAGRYQFLERTWKDIAGRYGLPDFSPQNQDLGAWYLANEAYKAKTGGDLLTDLKSGAYDKVASALSGTWTSLAGGIEAQPGGAAKHLAAGFNGVQPPPNAPAPNQPVAPTQTPAPQGLATAAPISGLATPQQQQPDAAALQAQQILASLMAPQQQKQEEQPAPRSRGLADMGMVPRLPINSANIKIRRMA